MYGFYGSNLCASKVILLREDGSTVKFGSGGLGFGRRMVKA